MTIYEDTNPKRLLDLLALVEAGDMVLPDFQRDFVWEPSATQALIVSIANSYPAGSILRVRDRERVFSARAFEGAPAASEHHTFLVLDGQQRLTSLYQAFYGKGDHRYYLSIQKLMDGEDFEDAISYLRITRSALRVREELSYQAEHLVLPLAVLRGGTGAYLDWMLMVVATRPAEERDQLQQQLLKIRGDWIDAFERYDFPVVTLSAETEPAALCTIFETLNRTGVKLSVFELLTARFWSHDLRLRDLWEQVRAEHPLISRFDVDPYYLLMAIALAGGQARSCKRGDVLNLTADTVIHWWPRVVKAINRALTILVDDCWVLQPRWMPYATMLPPMAAALACVDDTRGAAIGAQREQIRRWFWCSVFSQAYENAANTQSTRDVNELIAWFQDLQAQPPETVRSFRFNPDHLREVTPRQRSLYRATICLMLASGNAPLDFHTRAVLNHQLLDSSGIDDHHIFPAHYLDERGDVEPRQRDCVLNRCLIDRETNQRISWQAPSLYMEQMRNENHFPLQEVLKSHLIPHGSDAAQWNDDFQCFLSQRLILLAAAISGATAPL
ncbi:GmrSD restriction endonuclease domain-containing protein [Synechococcus sp. BA-132 BA5]|uniref:GmrSD restriction endonuclease domain-containing protein n=1 Tax=Synechococcus sp. BA-132 BA5 TaxID=3110252 RepID=UPI002B1FA1A0|nr:DUF262 domain-containing protein [Synechococcus sp. BA-132 BA5]MEA5416004.1 DUF262 domain-containing protein [Synechococcus sp. BA-132 BA5]